MSNTQFAQNVYEFQMEVFAQLLSDFDGKVVGSDDFNLDALKEKFFEGYTPGDAVKKEKKAKKEKKPRALSGYTYFGQQNRSTFNDEMDEIAKDGVGKPNFVTFAGKKWKALSTEEQAEWKVKATQAFEESQKKE